MGNRRVKRDNVTLNQWPVLKNDISIHNKIDLFNVIPQVLAEKIINNLTIMSYIAPRIIDPSNLNIYTEVNYEALYGWSQSVVKFGTKKRILQHISCIIYVQILSIN